MEDQDEVKSYKNSWQNNFHIPRVFYQCFLAHASHGGNGTLGFWISFLIPLHGLLLMPNFQPLLTKKMASRGLFSVIWPFPGQNSSPEELNFFFFPFFFHAPLRCASSGVQPPGFWARTRTRIQHKPQGKYLMGKISNHPCGHQAKDQGPRSHPFPRTPGNI